MFSAADLTALDRQLSTDALVLVPNFRSSRLLQDQLAAQRIKAGGAAVQAATRIIAVDLWLSDLWQQLALYSDDPRLGQTILTPVQETLLWESVIADSPLGDTLLNPGGTADTAKQAWLLLLQWQLPASLIKQADYGKQPERELPATGIFADWAFRFREKCKRKGVLSFSAMLPLLQELASTDSAALTALLPRKVLLWGFSEPPPLYKTFFDTLGKSGVTIETLHFSAGNPALAIKACQQVADEIQAAAAWAAAVLAQNPAAKIGIVCADLPALLANLRRTFARTLDDKNATMVLCTTQEPLAAAGFVHTALQLLQLHEDNCDTLVLCQLLRSPWLQGADTEAAARAQLTLRLRDRGEIRTSLGDFRKWCLDPKTQTPAPILGKALLGFHTAILRAPERASLHYWFGLFGQLWAALLNSASLQFQERKAALLAWEELQSHMLQCAFLLEQCSLVQALRTLNRVAHKQSQPALLQSAPVMIMSPLASAGLRFTHLWCLQMNEQQWPAENSPNPFLPLALQQQYQLPGSDPSQALQQAEQVLQMLRDNTSTELVYSYSLNEEDRQLSPSRLLPAADVALLNAGNVPAAFHPALVAFTPACSESVEESRFLPPQTATISGYSRLLESQAACPFQAFARERLHATELRPLRFGLSPAAVGSLVHKMFELFWAKFSGKAALLAAGATELEDWIADCVATALRETTHHYPGTMTPRFIALEQERLCALLQLWLQEELKRGDFRKLDVEQGLHWQYKNMQLDLRIDRIDADAQGHCVIIDYKTGHPKKVDWQAERQELPQLMLYQQAVEQSGAYPPVSALLHAWVNVEKPGFAGIGVSDDIAPGIAFTASEDSSNIPDWHSLKQHWQQSLQQLAQEFLDGYAAVNPIRASTCQYCHLASLCRIGEQRTAYEEADDDQADATWSEA